MTPTTPHTISPLRKLANRFADSSCLRLLQHPFGYYAQGNTLVRMTSGAACGLTGYRIRISRDRCLVTDAGGGLAVAIGGIHKDSFEEIGSYNHRD